MPTDKSQKHNKKESWNKRQNDPIRSKHTKNKYWIYGYNSVLAALNNPARTCFQVVSTTDILKNHGKSIKKAASIHNLEVEEVKRAKIDSLVASGAKHQGIISSVRPLGELSLDKLPATNLADRKILIALDQVKDPRNVGAIIRSAAVFGCDNIILPHRNSPRETGAMAKAASGALEVLGITRVSNLVRSLQILKKRGYWIIGLDPNASEKIESTRNDCPIVLVLGSEGYGLRRLTSQCCDALVSLPSVREAMAAGVDSLNVASAAAVALYAIRTKQSQS